MAKLEKEAPTAPFEAPPKGLPLELAGLEGDAPGVVEGAIVGGRRETDVEGVIEGGLEIVGVRTLVLMLGVVDGWTGVTEGGREVTEGTETEPLPGSSGGNVQIVPSVQQPGMPATESQ